MNMTNPNGMTGRRIGSISRHLRAVVSAPVAALRAVLVAVLRLRRAIVPAAVLLLVSGCTAEQSVTLETGMAGSSRMEIRLADYLVSYIRDLSASVGVETERIFEPAAIEAQFEQLGSIDLEEVQVPEVGRLILTLRFDDLAAALEDPASAAPLTVQSTSSEELHLRLELTPGILDSVIAMSPWEGTLMADILLPPDRTEMSGDEYIDYLVWALEEYEEPRRIRRSLEEAAVDLRVRVPGRIQRQVGGRRAEDGSYVRYRVPVVDLVTLDEAQVYELWYLPAGD
jgi:hypothetical protein